MEGCGALERTDFYQFLIWEGVVILIKLILAVSTLGWYGGPERTHFLTASTVGTGPIGGPLERTHF